MKKYILAISIIAICFLLLFVLKNVFLMDFMFLSNVHLDKQTNIEIRGLVLDYFRGNYTFFKNSDTATEKNLDNIHLPIDKKIICIINYDFMESVTKQENSYELIVKSMYPKTYYYHFSIQKMDGYYSIVNLELDT